MMWGSTRPAPIFGGDIFDPTVSPIAAAMAPKAPMAAAVARRPGFFGEGGTGRGLAGILGDALLQASGHQPVYAPLMAQQRQQQRELDTYARRRQDEEATWLRHQEYENTHRPPSQPTEFERELQAGGTLPGTPEWTAAMRRRSDNLLNPMTAIDVQQPDGSTVRQFIRPPAPTGAPAPPQPGEVRGGHRFRGGDPANPASWEPLSGAATNLRNWNGGASPSNGSGGFR